MKVADLYKAKALGFENGSGGGGGGDYLELSGGTMSGDINMDGNAVTGIGTPTNASDATPKEYVDDKIDENKEAFVAVYGSTTYEDVVAAIDANKVIMLDMPNNHNLFNMTYVTYTNGGNAIMYAIFKMNDRPTLMTATLTPADNWTIAHADLQDKLVSGTNIKTINNQSLLGSGNIDVSGGGGTVDTSMSDISTNAVQNKVIKTYVDSRSIPQVSYGSPLTTSVDWEYIINESIPICIRGLPVASTFPIVIAEREIIQSGNAVKMYGLYNDEQVLVITASRNNGWSYEIINIGGTIDTAMSDSSENAVQNKVIKSYVDTADTGLQTQLGDLTALTTDEKTNLVDAINEVYEKSGEPFRVKNWASSTLNVQVPACTEDIENTDIPKMDFTISDAEGADYQVVGIIAYELKDASGKRISCWPVCQFTGNGQKTLTLRWAGMGTTRKTATRINAWVLLKHR